VNRTHENEGGTAVAECVKKALASACLVTPR
jgi:hypothetical protein